MKPKFGLYENEVEPSTGINDHMIDCHLISRDEEIDNDEEAQG